MPSELIIEFMATFSRLEYALKSTKFPSGNSHRVDANWDAFANQIDTQFTNLQDNELINACSLLLTSPPRKQVLRNGQLTFKVQTVDQNQKVTQQILKFVRTVRNNLFHGGKYLPIGESEVGRNEALVRASLKILKACINLDIDVKRSYEH